MPTTQENAQRRYDVAFASLSAIKQRIRKDRRAVFSLNNFVVQNAPLLINRRIKVENKSARALSRYLGSERMRLLDEMNSNGALERIARDGSQFYNAARLPSDTPRQTKARVKMLLKETNADDIFINQEMQEASGSIFDFMETTDAYLLVMRTLLAEPAGRFVHDQVHGLNDEFLQEFVSRAAEDNLDDVAGFTDADMLLVDVVIAKEPLLLDTIAARANEITSVPLTDAEFDSLRDIIRRDLYENSTGALGAADIARDIREFLDKIRPDESLDDRAMLWARTEGAIIQNDALLARSRNAGMNGKIWQTVGDQRVREAHLLNEGDGVIPIEAEFSDGSTDGGSGSVSPFLCRCTVGGAMLSK